MAHFIGYTKGNRGEASRLGTKESGLSSEARGWNVGGSVQTYYDKERDCDIVVFYVNSGSNCDNSPRCIGSYIYKNNEYIKL